MSTGIRHRDPGAEEPRHVLRRSADGVVALLSGRWTSDRAGELEREIEAVMATARTHRRVVLDVSRVARLDTLGAWVLARARNELGEAGVAADFVGAKPEHRILLDEVAYRGFQPTPQRRTFAFIDILVDVGEAMVRAWRDLVAGNAFLGMVVAVIGRIVRSPRRFRPHSVVTQIEQIALRGAPIVILISFLVGAIVAQQGIFQLQRFGATAFAVNLVGILVLRELAVLLTSIMIAGRSGSAFTAEIGSMKMREEVDALRVMGLDPIEVLVLPRMIALLISLPLLTFLSMLAALAGGALVAWVYGGIGLDIFINRLQSAVGVNTFLVGLIKAPFMAIVIGVIACIEGLSVEGSAESLGRQVTASVVKSIFMVIVVDGIFAVFFAAIRF